LFGSLSLAQLPPVLPPEVLPPEEDAAPDEDDVLPEDDDVAPDEDDVPPEPVVPQPPCALTCWSIHA
jgi:hypothetical protein